MSELLRGPVTVANLTAAAGVVTTVDGWWPCLDLTWRTPVPTSITRIVAQVREQGSTGPVAETVVTPGSGAAKVVKGVSVGQHLQVRLAPAGAPGLPFQPTPWLDVTTPWDALIAQLDGLKLGCFTIVCGVGVPTRTDLEFGSFYIREDVSELWRYVGTRATGTGMVLGSYTVSMSKIPTEGNFLVAIGFGYAGQGAPNTGAGWTDIPTADVAASGFASSIRAAYRLCGSGESLSQTPFTGGSGTRAMMVWEVAGLNATWTPTFDAATWAHNTSGGTSGTTTRTTTSPNTLCLFAGDFYRGGTDPGVPTLLGSFTVDGTAQAVTVDGGQSLIAGHKVFPTSGVSASEAMSTVGVGGGVSVVMLSLSPGGTVVIGADVDPGAGWRKMSDLTSIKLNGVEIEATPLSLDFLGGFAVATDGAGNVTITAGGPTVTITASENLAAGDLVSFWNSSGAKVRRANATDDTKQVDGFVKAAVLSGAAATVYLPGAVNDHVSGLTPGAIYFLATSAGAITATPPTTAGQWLQEVGKAADATHLVFSPKTGNLL